MIAFVGQLVCLFVRYARRGFSYSASLNLLAFVDVSVTVYFERSRSTFKVVYVYVTVYFERSRSTFKVVYVYVTVYFERSRSTFKVVYVMSLYTLRGQGQRSRSFMLCTTHSPQQWRDVNVCL